MNKLIKNSFFSLLLSFSSVLFPFISAPYISRILNITDIGLINQCTAYATLFINLFSLGLQGYGAREIARNQGDEKKQQEIFSSVFITNLLLISIGIILYFYFIVKIHSSFPEKHLYLLFIIQIVANPLSIEWFYTGTEQFKYISLRSIFIKMISIIALFVCVKTSSDYFIYALLLVAAASLNSIFNLIHSRKFVRLSIKNLQIWQTVWKSKFFYLQTLVAILYQNLNQILLGETSPTQLAIFVRSVTLVTIIDTLVVPITNVVKPRLANVYGKDEVLCGNYIDKTFNLTCFIGFACSFGIASLSDEIMYIFGGHQFAAGGQVLGILALVKLATLVAVFLNEVVSTPAGFERNTFFSNLVVAIVACLANITLIPKYQGIGAAYALVIAETTGVLLHLILIKKEKLYVKFLTPKKIKYPIAAIIMSAIISIVKQHVISPYFRTIICIIVGGISYTFMIYWLSKILHSKSNDIIDIVTMMKDIVKRKNNE